MFLFTLVLGLLFLPEVVNLKCYQCSSNLLGNCSEDTTQCSSQNYRCLTATEVVFFNGTAVAEHNYKGCFMPELCFDFSINNGVNRWLQKGSCCDGDLCNNQINYQKPDKSTPNGKKCFSCDGENCMKTLNCVGDENYCVSVTGNAGGISVMTKGCASEMACTNQSALGLYQLSFIYLGLPSATNFSCCQGDHCNSASISSPALLLLLVPLLFSALFS